MCKHSPGPWTLQTVETGHNGYKGWDIFAIRSRHANLCLAVVGEMDRATHAHNAANAALMCSAPELLEALERLVYLAGPILAPVDGVNLTAGEQAINTARQAIAKAKRCSQNPATS